MDVEESIREACGQQDWRAAATLAIRGYGEEVAGYLAVVSRDVGVADEAFALACSNLWSGLPKFRWESTMKTWMYRLASNALARVRRDPYRRRRSDLDDPVMAALVAKTRTRTPELLAAENQYKLAAVRATLAPQEQALLILRVDRALTWREIARILADEGDLTQQQVMRSAATLRKQFERLKASLRERMAEA